MVGWNMSKGYRSHITSTNAPLSAALMVRSIKECATLSRGTKKIVIPGQPYNKRYQTTSQPSCNEYSGFDYAQSRDKCTLLRVL